MSCTTYRKSINGPRALIWVPIDPTSFLGYLRPYPLGSSPSLRHIGLNSYVINFVLFVHRSIWVLKNPQAGGST